ncbi:hypothetical protein FQZ97_1226650 [compost metagenome]
MPELAAHEVKQQPQHAGDRDQVEPFEVLQDEVGGMLKGSGGVFGKQGAKQHKGYYGQ